MTSQIAPARVPYLGVTRSALGRAWRARLEGPGLALAERLMQQAGLGDALARVLAARGVGLDELDRFLSPRLRDWLPDPDILVDLPAAVARLARAVKQREQVAVFGDYDVDGACASALLAGYLQRAGARPRIHIPDRLTEGYGPNGEAIRRLAAEGATLLVTVDCGTSSHEPLAEARRLGLDVVVIDHHQAPVELPEVTALVNPNRQDDVSGLGHLCATGVVFMVLVGLARALRGQGVWPPGQEPSLLDELDLVALATVADVVPITGLNRAFVSQGLAILRQRARPGTAALIDVSGLKGPLEAWHLGFLLGPRINAGGRIGDAALGARLLLCGDEIEAREIALRLDDLNRERQAIERAAVEDALAQIARDCPEADGGHGGPAVLVAASADWHPGVVGLVAARLKERFRRPAFALALDGSGAAVGSGRSVPGVDLGSLVRGALGRGLLIKGGGHGMAAGVTLNAADIPAFACHIAEAAERSVAAALADDALTIDAGLSARGATPALVAEVARSGPFGSGAPEPVFAFAHHRIAEASVVGSGGHVRLKLVSGDGAALSGVAFRAADQPLGAALLAARGSGPVHVAGTLSVDRWGGGEKVELKLTDMATPAAGA